MAQIDQELYASIAAYYAEIDTSLTAIESYAKSALEDIVNITTSNYPTPNPSVIDPDLAIEIELALLSTFNSAYLSAKNTSLSVSGITSAVKAINGYVINNSSYSGTADAKLTDWINTSMAGHWEGTTYCPLGWKNLSEDSGYDTSDWTTS